MTKHIFWVGVIFIIMGIIVFCLDVILKYKIAELNLRRDMFDWQQKVYQKDLIKFCQQLDVNKINPNWGYKSCIESLINNKPIFKD